MSPRTLWTILLRIFGIYIFLQVLCSLPQIFAIITFSTEQHDSSILAQIAYLLFSVSIYLFILIAFIFRTDWLINTLNLNRGITEEKLELNIHRSTVLKITIIIAGFLLLIEALPLLAKEIFTYFQVSNLYNGFRQYLGGGWIIFHLVKVFIGFFMVTSNRLIVNFIDRKRKGKTPIPDAEV